MSVKIHIKAPSKSVIEYLKGVVEAMKNTNADQLVNLTLELYFEMGKKKDC